MAISLKSFLVLEKSLTQVTLRALSKTIRDDITEILTLLDLGEVDLAAEKLQAFSVSDLDTSYLGRIGLASLLFGASQVDPSFNKSVLLQEHPQNLLGAANIMAGSMVMAGVTSAIRKTLVAATIKAKIGQSQPSLLTSISAPTITKDIKTSVHQALLVANGLHVSRVASYGFLLTAASKGITTYVRTAQLDNHTCPICSLLDGKEFSVAPALSRVSAAMSASTPEDLKFLQPWASQTKESVLLLKGMTSADISAQGLDAVPSHPRCRCHLQKKGE